MGELKGVRVRCVQKQTEQGLEFVTTTLYAGGFSRTGAEDSASAYDIIRPGLKKTIRVYVKQKTYQELPLFSLLSPEQMKAELDRRSAWRKRYLTGLSEANPPDYSIVVQYRKTEERKVMFGCQASKWQTVVKRVLDQGDPVELIETAANSWYLGPAELARVFPEWSLGPANDEIFLATINGSYPRVMISDELPRGLCVLSETWNLTTPSANAETIFESTPTTVLKVEEMVKEAFSTELFAAPKGFRKIPLYPSRLSMLGSRVTDRFSRLRTALRQSSV